MRTDIHIHWLDAFVFLAIFQTFYISFFIIRSGIKSSKANIYQGLFLLSFAILAVEELLYNTGYASRVLPLVGFSQPLNYSMGPCFFLYVAYSLYPDQRQTDWLHLLLPAFWCFYIWFYLLQPDSLKYNSYISLKHPDWPTVPVTQSFSQDPLFIRQFANELTIISLLIYEGAAFLIILKKLKSLGQPFFGVKSPQVIMARNAFLHSFLVAVVFSLLKISKGMTSDIGMIVITYFCVYIFLVSFNIMTESTYFGKAFSVLDFPVSKYQKSSLTEAQKDEILAKIKVEMEQHHFFANNLSSLSGLADNINQSTHHVSQVINERMNKTYFELVSSYRIEYAKKLLSEDSNGRLTIEELAEKVGYNSKSSFNSAFKKNTSLTPTEFRNSQ